jgi:hypothetical protein
VELSVYVVLRVMMNCKRMRKRYVPSFPITTQASLPLLLIELTSCFQSQNQLQSQSLTPGRNISQRTTEITQIATSITELADLFRDLSTLVVEQGTILDSVEYNVQTTARELKAGVEELKIAQRSVTLYLCFE